MVYQTPARWTGLDDWFDRTYRVLSGSGSIVIFGSRTCPEEYRLWPGQVGSPPKPEFYQKYAGWAAGICSEYHPWGWEDVQRAGLPEEIRLRSKIFREPGWTTTTSFPSRASCIGEFCAEVYPLIRATGAVVISRGTARGAVVA